MSTTSTFKCDKCADAYWYTVMKNIDDEIDPKGPYPYWQKCSCWGNSEEIDKFLSESGIRKEDFERKTLKTFKADNEMTRKMKDIAYRFLRDINKADGCGFFGNSGTGKTHICIAICQDLTRTYVRPFKYFSYREEVQRLKSIYFKKSYHEEIKKIIDAPLLYIDDFLKFAGTTDGKINTQELQIAYEIINGRYIRKAKTIFSSEYSVNEMRSIDEALASRVYEMVGRYAMKCEGRNRRFEI